MDYELDSYKKFLSKVKKNNGDKLLPKTLEAYIYYIKDILFIINQKQTNEEIVDFMNQILLKRSNIVHYSALKLFLLFIGIESDSELIRKLKAPKKNSSALTSQRMLQNKMLTESQLSRLFNEVDDEWKLIFSFLFDTAMRRNEFLSMKWGDIIIKKVPDGNIYAEIYVLGKSSKSRTVFITKTTFDLLKKLKGLPNQDNSKKKVFIFYQDKQKKKPYINQAGHLLKETKKIIKEVLGIDRSLHGFRHSKLSSMAEQGADILKISRYAGHSGTNTTEVYIKNASFVGRNAFKEFDRGIEGDLS